MKETCKYIIFILILSLIIFMNYIVFKDKYLVPNATEKHTYTYVVREHKLSFVMVSCFDRSTYNDDFRLCIAYGYKNVEGKKERAMLLLDCNETGNCSTLIYTQENDIENKNKISRKL